MRSIHNESVILQRLGEEPLSAVGHAQSMTKPWDPVWQCWRRNFTLSAVLNHSEPVTRECPRTQGYYGDGNKDLDEHILVEKRREERAVGVHHRYGRLYHLVHAVRCRS